MIQDFEREILLMPRQFSMVLALWEAMRVVNFDPRWLLGEQAQRRSLTILTRSRRVTSVDSDTLGEVTNQLGQTSLTELGWL